MYRKESKFHFYKLATQIFSIADIFTSTLLVCLFSAHLILNTMDGTPVFEKPDNTAPNEEIIFYNKVLTFCLPGDLTPDPTKVPSRHTVNEKLEYSMSLCLGGAGGYLLLACTRTIASFKYDVPRRGFIAGIIVVNMFFMNLHLIGAVAYQNIELCWLDYSVAGMHSYYYQPWILYGTLLYIAGFKIFGLYVLWTWLDLAVHKRQYEQEQYENMSRIQSSKGKTLASESRRMFSSSGNVIDEWTTNELSTVSSNTELNILQLNNSPNSPHQKRIPVIVSDE